MCSYTVSQCEREDANNHRRKDLYRIYDHVMSTAWHNNILVKRLFIYLLIIKQKIAAVQSNAHAHKFTCVIYSFYFLLFLLLPQILPLNNLPYALDLLTCVIIPTSLFYPFIFYLPFQFIYSSVSHHKISSTHASFHLFQNTYMWRCSSFSHFFITNMFSGRT